MKLLLDTHVFLWWITDDPRLSPLARDVMGDGQNILFLSAASGWEIAIKARLGKLSLPAPVVTFVPAQMAKNGIEGLPVLLSHALHESTLPNHHRDPFDRMIVAQSQMERLPVLTGDPLIAQYSVERIW
jgi:PIN domain nuclease of toxin-antitoxin system